jgi:hypothetical protein
MAREHRFLQIQLHVAIWVVVAFIYMHCGSGRSTPAAEGTLQLIVAIFHVTIFSMVTNLYLK